MLLACPLSDMLCLMCKRSIKCTRMSYSPHCLWLSWHTLCLKSSIHVVTCTFHLLLPTLAERVRERLLHVYPSTPTEGHPLQQTTSASVFMHGPIGLWEDSSGNLPGVALLGHSAYMHLIRRSTALRKGRTCLHASSSRNPTIPMSRPSLGIFQFPNFCRLHGCQW